MSSGSKEMGFKVVEGWGKLPDGWSFGHVIGCAVNADDNVYVLNRGEHSMMIFDREGNLTSSWEVKLPTSRVMWRTSLITIDIRYKNSP